MSTGAELRINGEAFGGFEAGSVTLTMEDTTNHFDVEYVAPGDALGARMLYAGDATELALDGDVLLSGYVEETQEDDEATAIRLRAIGRSKTGDLVDCSFLPDENRPGRWTNATLERIVKDLCLPFGIDVHVDGLQGNPFATFSVQKGESIAEAVSRAAVKRGKVVYTVGGELVLASAGSTRTATVLQRGKNLVRSGRSDSWFNRYSDYVFRAQTRGSDGKWGALAGQLKNAAYDETITRYRPLLVQAEANDEVDLKTRAEFERNQRAGRGERILAVVDGWTTDEGTAWRPNTLVRFSNPVLGVDATLLVATVRFRFGADMPRETELELARPEAFDLVTYPALGRGIKWT